MTERVEAVLIANARFYRALSLADTSAMRGLWLQSPEATCLHPGRQEIKGYAYIQQSWAVIFANQGPIRIWPSHEEVTLRSDLAWVTCIENIDASATTANKIVCVRARNAFRHTAAGWKMLHHLAEAMPGHETQLANQRLAYN